MARKKLLSEGEVRQFMKLANLGPLSENYFTNNPLEEQLPPEEDEMEMDMGAEEAPVDDLPPEDEVPMGDEEGLEGAEPNEAVLARVVQAVADELGVEVDVEGGAEEGGDELEAGAELEEPLPGGEEGELPPEGGLPGEEDELMERTIKRALKELGLKEQWAGPGDRTGANINKRRPQSLRKPGEDDPLEAFGGPEFEAELGGEGEFGEPEGECVPGDEECEAGLQGLEEHDAIVAEVSRRVAARLTADKRKEAVAEQLAERIFKRLTQK